MYVLPALRQVYYTLLTETKEQSSMYTIASLLHVFSKYDLTQFTGIEAWSDGGPHFKSCKFVGWFLAGMDWPAWYEVDGGDSYACSTIGPIHRRDGGGVIIPTKVSHHFMAPGTTTYGDQLGTNRGAYSM